MPFQCAICEEESHQICVYCTKDTCGNHICEKCLRCSDCCGCEVPLEEAREPAAEAVLAQGAGAGFAGEAGAETSAGAADTSVCATPEAGESSAVSEEVAGVEGGAVPEGAAPDGAGGAVSEETAAATAEAAEAPGGGAGAGADRNVCVTSTDGSVGGAETLFGAEAAREPAGVPAEDVAGQAADKDLSSPGHV
jgi:hypothetical protein